jgi:hypothetical protein
VDGENKTVGLLSAGDITESAGDMINMLQEVIRTIDAEGIAQRF